MERVQELFGVWIVFFDQFGHSGGLRERVGVHWWDRDVISLDSLRDGNDFGDGGLCGHGEGRFTEGYRRGCVSW